MKTHDRIVIYARGHRAPDLYSRIYVPIFSEASFARGWMEFFLDGETYHRQDDTLKLDGGILIKSEQLDRILEAKPSDVSPLDERRILRFKHGTWDEPRPRAVGTDDATSPRPAKVERETRPERPPGFVTISDLCAGSDVLPMIARAMLRASGREKPPYGWAFDPKEIEAIKEICGIK